MKELLNTIKSEFPDKAEDIKESLDLLSDAISSTIYDVSSELNESIKLRDKNGMDKYNMLAREGFKYEELIDNIINILNVEEKNI